jgi:hypothetical protein
MSALVTCGLQAAARDAALDKKRAFREIKLIVRCFLVLRMLKLGHLGCNCLCCHRELPARRSNNV